MQPELFKHITVACDSFKQGVLKSLRLNQLRLKIIEQVEALNRGEVVPGVSPFKQSINVPELDLIAPAEVCKQNFEIPTGASYRKVQ